MQEIETKEDRDQDKYQRKEWEKPMLKNIDIKDTMIGIGSPADAEGPTTP